MFSRKILYNHTPFFTPPPPQITNLVYVLDDRRVSAWIRVQVDFFSFEKTRKPDKRNKNFT